MHVKEPCDDRTVLHVVDTMLAQPVETLEEEKDGEEGRRSAG